MKFLNWLLLIMLFAVASCATTPPVFVGSGEAGYIDEVGEKAQFNFPTDIVTDSNGNLYVADTGNRRIRKVTPEGKVTTVNFPNGEPVKIETRSLYVDNEDNLYIADNVRKGIIRISPDNKFTFITGSELSKDFEKLNIDILKTDKEFIPELIAVDKDKKIFVVSRESDFYYFDKSLKLSLVDDSYISNIRGMAIVSRHIEIDNTGTIYFSRAGGTFESDYVVYKVNQSKKEITEFTNIDKILFPTGITLDEKDNLFIVGRGSQSIFKLNTKGEILYQISLSGVWPDEYSSLALDNQRKIVYLSSRIKNKIHKVNIKQWEE